MKHLSLNEIHPDNYRLYVEKPDRNFSPQRNYAVITQVIEENDRMQTKLSNKVKDNAANVADILSSFAKYKLDRDGGKQLNDWLGRGWQTRVYSDQLLSKIRMAEVIQLQQKERQRKNPKLFL